MITAYVLINSHIGKERDVASMLIGVDEVKDVLATDGTFDVVAKVESNSRNSLQDLIQAKIRKMESVRSALTLVDSNCYKSVQN